jgi:hypothetical membrane protein
MPYGLRKIFEPRVAAWLGAIAPLCAVASIGVSIAISPWFSWTHNALSDLGVSEAALIFNSGLIVTGILLSIFAIALAQVEHESLLGLAGAMELLLVGVSAVGVGVFSEDFIRMHIFFALTCFISLILSSILLGVHFTLKRETRGLGALALSAGTLSIVVWFAIRLPGVAIQEALSAFPAVAWFVALSVRLHRESGTAASKA